MTLNFRALVAFGMFSAAFVVALTRPADSRELYRLVLWSVLGVASMLAANRLFHRGESLRHGRADILGQRLRRWRGGASGGSRCSGRGLSFACGCGLLLW